MMVFGLLVMGFLFDYCVQMYAISPEPPNNSADFLFFLAVFFRIFRSFRTFRNVRIIQIIREYP